MANPAPDPTLSTRSTRQQREYAKDYHTAGCQYIDQVPAAGPHSDSSRVPPHAGPASGLQPAHSALQRAPRIFKFRLHVIRSSASGHSRSRSLNEQSQD